MTQFTGFPAEGLRFLRALKRNNTRDWFLEHKEIYQTEVRAPMEALVWDIGNRLKTLAPEFTATPRTSIYRIYRDTRFSKDKTPYKTHIAAIFPHRDLGKHQGAGFYVHVAPGDVFAGGGLYRPEKRDLQSVRLKIAEDHVAFRRLMSRSGFQKMFGALSGEQLQRVPRGFSPDHPAAGLLSHKQFLAGRSLDAEIAQSPDFLREVVLTFRALVPLCRFLNSAIEAGRSQPDPLDPNLGRAAARHGR